MSSESGAAPMLDEGLFGPRPASSITHLATLQAEVLEKSLQHWYDYRAVNGFYIYGGRKKPFGVVNFPVEFKKLRKMIANEPAIAAQLLLNISKMLCARILKDR